MVPKTSLTALRATFFATLGLSPLVACSSSSDSGTPATGTGGSTLSQAGSGGSLSAGSGGTGGNGLSSGGAGTGTGASPGTGGSMSTGGSPGTGGTPAGTDAGPPSICKNPRPRLGLDGKPTGFVDCDGGFSHRSEKKACASALPRATACGSGEPVSDAGLALGECSRDADCKAQANGYCVLSAGGLATAGCSCSYGCTTDSDCGPGEICGCGDPVGQCVPAANCTVDAECGAGMLCMSSSDGGCGATFGCQSAADTCATGADCTSDAGAMLCAFVTDHHECSPMHPCGTGRPFLVGGAARVAVLSEDPAWASSLSPRLDGLDDAARASLAARWTEIALMEHASIAAFARFALELLSLGAPPELVVATHAAMADETVHARDAFALASAYAGRPVGPGPLDVDRALGVPSLLSVVRTAILEGCIGETVAAVEAAEALAEATDPAVRAALERVVVDETRHAELAWRFVKWALESGTAATRHEVSAALTATVRAERGASAGVRRRVLEDVVAPCAAALVSQKATRSEPALYVTA